MKTRIPSLLVAVLFAAAWFNSLPGFAQPADPGWPRVFKQDKIQLTVYQPQVDHWNGYTNIHFRCAIGVKGVLKQEKFGVAEVDAVTVVDQTARVVALVPTKRELRFANVTDPDQAKLRAAVDKLKPPGQALTLSLDRLIAYLDPTQQPVQPAVDVNLQPPQIFSSITPAILVMFMGEPQFKPVATNRTDLMFALNTNWDVLYDTATQRYYLLNGEGWLTTGDVLKGPWTPTQTLPPLLNSLPNTENWTEVRKGLPGKPAKMAPTVFVTTGPAEMILTDGPPSYMPVKGTRLMRVNNTASVLFLHSGDKKMYFQVAGRWFRGDSLSGPWSAASADLPADFLQIPDTDPAAFVKASVPGTREANDAVLLASVPTTVEVEKTNVTLNVTYSGQPQFVTITNTVVQYAVNTPNQVFRVSGSYYCCAQGAWFVSANPTGPWSLCASVPSAIYTIPPSNPNYNVTYVTVQSATPTTVVYSQTSGYSGEYVAATGVLMFGMGMLMGAAIADDHYDHYHYPSPCHYSYGCGAVYYHGGGYYGSAHVSYGPYGGAGRTASYNAYTGTYARSSYAYGPYGSASRGAAYNPYTGARAAGGQINTAYGSAGRFAGYNPSTGNAVRGGYRSGDYGSAGAIRTSQGSGMAAWDTQNSQGAIAKTRSGDIYAGKDGTVYRKDSNGGWSQNSGSGWTSPAGVQSQSTSRGNAATASRPPQTQSRAGSGQVQRPTASTSAAARSAPTAVSAQQRSSLESQAQARQRGNQQAQRAQSWQGSGSSRSFGAQPSASSTRSSGFSGRSAGGGRSGGGRR